MLHHRNAYVFTNFIQTAVTELALSLLISSLIPSGNFIWNHYCEALNSIQTLTAELAAIKAELYLTDEDLSQILKDKHDYLDGLKLPPVRDQLCIHYVEVLDELAQWQWVKFAYCNHGPDI